MTDLDALRRAGDALKPTEQGFQITAAQFLVIDDDRINLTGHYRIL